MPARKPIPPGTRFTRFIVTDTTPQRRFCGGSIRYYVECRCDCGVIKWTSERLLRLGESKSCGCLKRESTIMRSTVHGYAHRKQGGIYRVWADMIQRCTNPKNAAFKNYGGRGISVDPPWIRFPLFLEDMGEPKSGMTLERKDVNGNYCKSNCCWIPRSKQSQNRRDTILLSAFGVTACMSELSRQHGIANITVWQRVKNGAHPECALSKDGWVTRDHILACPKCRSITKVP